MGTFRPCSLLMGAAMLLPACSPEAAPVFVKAGPTSGALSAPFDLGAVILQVRHAFRAEGDTFVARGGTHEVRATDTSLEVAPIADGHAAAPLVVHTARIERGGQALFGGAAKSHVETDGHLAITRGDVVAELHNQEDGVELSYTFAHAPASTGDLVVRLDIAGQAFRGLTESGLHYVDTNSGLGTRMGRATWVDARGVRSDVPLVAVAGGVELRVPSSLVETSAYPAVLDPLVSAEKEVDQPIPGAASGQQVLPSVAFNGAEWLVTWLDKANTKDSTNGSPALPRLVAARVDLNGGLLDPLGIDLGYASGAQAASDGKDFLVVYDDPTAVRAARVTGAGLFLGSLPILDAAANPGITHRDIAWGHGQYVLVSAKSDGTSYITRLSASGLKLDPFDKTPLGTTLTNANIASGTDGFLVVGSDAITFTSVNGARLDMQGKPSSFLAQPIGSGYISSNKVLFDGTQYIVAWLSFGSFTTARVTTTGTIVDPGGVELVFSDFVNGDFTFVMAGLTPTVLWSEAEDFVYNRKTYMARVASNGTLAGGVAKLLTATGESAAAAPGIDKALAVWVDQSDDYQYSQGESIGGSRIDGGGNIIDVPTISVSRTANTEREPALTFDGQNFLAFWSDDRNYSSGKLYDLIGTRISPAGTVLDPAGIVIATTTKGERMPQARFDGMNTVVSYWSCEPNVDFGPGLCDLVLARVSPGGVLLGSTSLAAPGSAIWNDWQQGALESGGSSTLAAGFFTEDPVYWMVDQAGVKSAALSPPVVGGGGGPLTDYDMAASFDGTNHILFWNQQDSGTSRIFGARINPQGQLIDATAIPISPPGTNAIPSASTFDGQNHVLIWATISGKTRALRATRVSPAGVVIDAQPIEISAFPICKVQGFSPIPERNGVAFDGTHVLVTWSACGQGTSDIYVAELDTQQGSVAAIYPITNDVYLDEYPALTSTADGTTLVAYSSYRPEAPFRSKRMFFRRIGAASGSGGGGGGGGGGAGGSGSGSGGGGAGGSGSGGAGAGGGGSGGGSGGAGGSGSGGAGGGETGSGGAGGGGRPDTASGGGCTCQLGGETSRPGLFGALALSLALVVRRRRSAR